MKKIIFVLILLFPLNALSQEKSLITKEVGDGLYKNSYFDLVIQKPDSWYFQPPEDTIKMGQMGGRMLAGDDKQMEAIFKESLKTAVALFSFFKFAPGTPVDKNANVVGVAENISLAPGLKTGCDYIYHARKLLQQSNVNYIVEEGCSTFKLSNNNFGLMKASVNMLGVDVFQNYNVCIKNEHAIVIIQTYFDNESKAETKAILESLKVVCNQP